MAAATFAPPRSVVASPLPVSLVDRLAAVAWKPPAAHLPGPPPAVLETGFPSFQAACCEICGSICSPLSLQYRDTATVLYRVQQHCRKLVPSVLNQQSDSLALARSAQRGVLDVTDSLSIIDTLNSPVLKSMADVALVTTRAAARAKARQKEAEHEERQREKRRVQQMNASGSLPTTPMRGDRSSSNSNSHRASIALDSTTLSHEARAELEAASTAAASSSSSAATAAASSVAISSVHPIVSPSAVASLQSFPLPSPVRPSSPSATTRRGAPATSARRSTLPPGPHAAEAAAVVAAHQRTASNAVAAAASRANRRNTGTTGFGLTSPLASSSSSSHGSLLEDSHDAQVRTTHMGAFALLHSPEEASPLREHAVSEFVP